jgi:hypothetical protein
MSKRFLIAALGAATLAVPTAALADHGQGTGKPDNPGSQGKGQSHRCAKTHTVGFQLHGDYASFDETTLTLTLTNAKGNKHARSVITNGSASIAIGTAKVSFAGLTDTNTDGLVGWDDATSADKVVVHGRVAKAKHGCPAAGGQTAPTIQRVKVVAPDQTGDTQPES